MPIGASPGSRELGPEDWNKLHVWFAQQGYTVDEALCLCCVWVGLAIKAIEDLKGVPAEPILHRMEETIKEAYCAEKAIYH